MNKIPVTIVSGYLGSGKTTIIINLVKQLDPKLTVVWLKNEYGDINTDSELAKEHSIKVSEVLNGCICCIRIGVLQDALHEIIEKYSPSRIIIESSGTAFPAPIAWEVQKINELTVDGVISVIDAINFSGYKDTSYSAVLQLKFVDLFIINKVSGIPEEVLDRRLDDVYEFSPSTPKVFTADGVVSKDVFFGLSNHDMKEFNEADLDEIKKHHHDDNVEVFGYVTDKKTSKDKIEPFLASLAGRNFYRIKGIIETENGFELMNFVAGRITWELLNKYDKGTKISFMGNQVLKEKEFVLKTIESVFA
jgi:G3E family GTPase